MLPSAGFTGSFFDASNQKTARWLGFAGQAQLGRGGVDVQRSVGDGGVCDDTGLLPKAPCITPVRARRDGYLSHVNGTALGLAAQQMGAGRLRKEDIIDPAVGFVMEKRIGDFVAAGDAICTLHARSMESARATEEKILAALEFSPDPVPPATLLYALVTPEGVSRIEA